LGTVLRGDCVNPILTAESVHALLTAAIHNTYTSEKRRDASETTALLAGNLSTLRGIDEQQPRAKSQ
jgi:hypothetical protein